MPYDFTSADSLVKEILVQYESSFYEKLLSPINDFIKKGILKYECEDPILVCSINSDEIKIMQKIKLICPLEDEVEHLKKEIAKLSEIIDSARYS